MLQVVISPAKKMRVARDAFEPTGIPPYPEKTEALLARLHGMGRAELQALWKTSDKLTDAACDALQELEAVPRSADELAAPRFAASTAPAVFAYEGIQYQSMAPGVMDTPALAWLRGHLWILSGFYGCVRPFDAVAPYRLEMGAKLSMPADEARGREAARDLYAFWGADLARAVAGVADGGAEDAAAGSATSPCTVVNLASVEYAKAVLPHLPAGARSVTCVFGESLRAGKPVQRATASKIARGSMVRWMAENRVEDAQELERFDVGYAFAPELSHTAQDPADPATLVFMRG